MIIGAEESTGVIMMPFKGVIAAVGATSKTNKSRRKESKFGETGGLKGSSRTKANKDITEAWSGAVVGTGASIGGAAAGAAIGQVGRISHVYQ